MKTQKISRVLKHFLLLGVFVFITITINALDYNIQNAPVTKATTICNAEVGMQVNVPITVTGFSNISAVSLTMIYDASKLRYVNFTKNPLLVGTCNVGDKDLLNGFHRLTLSWFKAQSPGITMEDGTPIVNYIFEFISGPATLEWADMGPSCEFVDPNGTILTDTPTSNFYVNGVISSSCQSIPTISPSGPTSFCEGGSVDLTASTGTAYLWSPGGETTQTITATTNGNFTVEVTNADGTKATSEPTVVTVSTLPAAPTASVTDQTSCTSPSGTIVITSPIEDGMTYSINGSDYYASLIFFGVVPGDYYVTAKNAAGCISQPSGKLTVNDQPTTPTVNINNPPAVCSPATVDLTVTSITTGSSPDLTFTYWEDVSATTAIQTPESVSGGLYYIKGTALSGCYDIEPVIVTVSGHPMINIHDPQEACSPSTVDLTSPNITWGSSSGLTYTYYKDADATTPVATPSQIAESGTYYIKGTLETGCFDIKAVQVVVNMNVPVSVSISPDNNNVCVGTSVTFTATPVGGGTTPHYLWYKGTIPVGDDQATYTYIPSDGDVISVELWSSEICATGNPATSEPITMLVKSLPLTPTAEATQPSCTVATGTIIVSSETEGLTFSIDGADYTNTTGMFTGLIPGDYFVTAQNAAGCISQPSVKLTIEAQSEMPSTPLISATGAIILCAGSSVLLTSSSSVGNQWYKDGLLIGNATSQTYLANTSGSYSVIVSSNGCLSAPAEAIVVTENLINSGEIAKGATNPGPGCGTLNPGLTANTSSATGSGAITYSWQQSDNEGINWTTIASATTDKYNPEAFTKTRWYKRIATSTLNSVECSAESNVLMYLVNPLPEVSSILPGGTTNVCVGSTLQFSNATIGGEWSSANDGIATVNSSGLVRGVSPGSVIISYTVTNENLCSKSGTKTVNVIALPVADILGSNSICIGKTTTLSPQGGGSWISNNPTVASVSSTGLVTGLTAGNATFTFTNGISPYCSATTLPVSVNDLPTANITNDNGLVLSCNIPSTTLTASGGISYLWSTGAQTEAIIVSTPGSYSVTATGNAGCVSAEASVTVSAQFDAPLAPTAEVTQPSCTVATGTISVTSDKTDLSFSIDGLDYSNSSGIFSGLVAGEYFVTAQNADGCVSAQSDKLTIDAQPLAPAAPTAGVNPEFVIGSGQVVFSAITSAGSIKWYDAAFEGTEVQVLNPTISETTTYYAEAISPEGCISASRTAVTANVISSGTTQLSYRFANPRIMNGSGFNRFEFDIQVKASSAGTTFRNGNVNIKFEPSTLSTNVGNWTASAVSDHTTVLEISGSTLNIELTEGITGTELTTDYQTLVTVSAIITDENGVAGIDFNEDNMNGQQFYKLSESPRYAIYFNPNLYDAADFVDTYVGRVYSENSALSLKSATMSTIWPGWTQIASLNWDSNENTSVWNGDAAIPGGVLAIASNLRIHIQATLAVPDNGEMTVAGDTEIKPANGLIFESDANGTGSFITNTSSGAGSAVAKRYMTTDAWHIVASSVSGQSILEFLNSNPSIATSEDDEVRGMMDYNPTLNDWNDYFTNASGGNLETGKGFSMRTNENTAVSFAGKLQSGNLSATGLTSAKWNCVGNPYSSAIAINANSSNGADDFLNVNAIVLQNLDPSYSAIYVWDRPDAFNGVWGEYTIISNTPEFGSDAAFDIQQGQAFMVKMNTSATNIDFNPDMQFHATILPLKSSKVIWPTIKLKVAGNSGKSSTIIAFNSRMTKGLDPTYDAGLLKGGSDLMVYSRLVEDNGIPFAIQALPTNEYDHLIIPIGVDFKTGGEVIFSSELIDLSSDCMAILEDKESKTFTDLSKKDYTTTIAANSSSTDRFQLHTSYLTTGAKEEFGTQRLSAYAIRNVEMIVNGKVSSEAIALVYDVLGKLIVTKELERGNRNSISLPSIRTGIYMLSVHDHGKVQGFKISVKE